MPLEALLIPVNLTDSDSDGINGGTGCNFIFISLKVITVLSWKITTFFTTKLKNDLFCAIQDLLLCFSIFRKIYLKYP